METQSDKLHIFFFPLMAQGHIRPILDIAKLFSSRQVKTTIITTPKNSPRLTKSIQSSSSTSQISLKLINFPPQEPGSPEHLENLDSVTGHEDLNRFFTDLSLLQEPLKQAIEESKPHGLVSDFFFPWTADLASDFRIPRLIFHATTFFSMCCMANLRKYQPHKKVDSDTELFSLPEFPDFIQFSRNRISDHLLQDQPSVFSRLFGWAEEVEKKSFGIIVNTFYELESSYADYYRKNLGKRSWHIGPVSIFNKKIEQKAQTTEAHECMKWLDSKKPDSVLYICFGTVVNFSDSQLRELAIGLENSGQQFIWVVRRKNKEDEKPRSTPEVCSKEEEAASVSRAMTTSEEKWIPDGYEKRIEGKGLIIRGWAPQVLILDHASIGGFVTHCGCNSVLEGVTAGLPMVTWPIFADQFFNEKLITDVLQIGVAVGAQKWVRMVGDYVESGKIEKAIKEIMVGEKSDEIRRKAKKLGEIARNAVEFGGSSYNDLSALIEELESYHA